MSQGTDDPGRISAAKRRAICGSTADSRPFYHRFAWAYDLLLDEPIDARVAGIASLLGKCGVGAHDTLLDAGCGTGRYASGLANHGFHVVGVDRSAELIEVARARPAAATAVIRFLVGDLTALRWPGQFGAILCRGVLNDLLTDHDREQAVRRFAELAAPGAALLLDVRDWSRTAERYRVRSSTDRAMELEEGGHLTFRSETTLEPAARQMIVSEILEFREPGSGAVERHATEFRMRCWSASELHERLEPWFEDMEILADYVVPPAWQDRLVAVATRKGLSRSSG